MAKIMKLLENLEEGEFLYTKPRIRYLKYVANGYLLINKDKGLFELILFRVGTRFMPYQKFSTQRVVSEIIRLRETVISKEELDGILMLQELEK